MRIKENSFIASMGAWKLKTDKIALVIGGTVHLHNTTREEFLQNKRWVRHEEKHIEQYKKHGVISFLIRYIFESIRSGYYNNKFEVEARKAEDIDY
jgi:hypothetical protein